MKDVWDMVQIAAAALGGFAGWFLGGWDGFVFALVAFVVLDYLTGFMRAVAEKRLSSQVGALGIMKKVLIFFIVGAAHVVDTHLLGGAAAPLRTAVIFFYIANEGVSLLENTAAIGLPVPNALKQALAQLHDHKEDDR